VFGVVVFFSTMFFSLVGIAAGLIRARKGAYDWVHRNWSRTVLRTAGVEVRVSGLENVEAGGAQIFVCNHQSMFDIWALFATLPVSLRFITKKELSRIPIFAHAMRYAGHVFIDRKDRAQAAEAMRRAGARMQAEGLSLGLFPEGTRSRDGVLGSFKKGSFALAIETQTTLVPIAIDGGAEITAGPMRIRPRAILMSCGQPIPLAGMTVQDRDALMTRSRAQIAGMLERARGAPPVPEERAAGESARPAASGPA
jgi:1-acyl-sn-glycerol-3-phosphate acyltransferase